MSAFDDRYPDTRRSALPPPDLPVCSVIKEQTGRSRLMSDIKPSEG